MNWTKETAMNLISDCKQFRICKAFVHGEPTYTLSHGPLGKAELVHTGRLDDCKAMAETMKEAKAA